MFVLWWDWGYVFLREGPQLKCYFHHSLSRQITTYNRHNFSWLMLTLIPWRPGWGAVCQVSPLRSWPWPSAFPCCPPVKVVTMLSPHWRNRELHLASWGLSTDSDRLEFFSQIYTFCPIYLFNNLIISIRTHGYLFKTPILIQYCCLYFVAHIVPILAVGNFQSACMSLWHNLSIVGVLLFMSIFLFFGTPRSS